MGTVSRGPRCRRDDGRGWDGRRGRWLRVGWGSEEGRESGSGSEGGGKGGVKEGARERERGCPCTVSCNTRGA